MLVDMRVAPEWDRGCMANGDQALWMLENASRGLLKIKLGITTGRFSMHQVR